MSRTTDRLVKDEVDRQDRLHDDQVAVPDDRWMEIVDEKINDLRWAVRSRMEKPNHTIEQEQIRTIAVLYRWLRAAEVTTDVVAD